MILKSFRGKDADISELEALLAQAPAAGKALIEQESWQVRVGNKWEKESANFIDFACDTSVVLNSVDNVGNKTQANPPYVGKKPWSVPNAVGTRCYREAGKTVTDSGLIHPL